MSRETCLLTTQEMVQIGMKELREDNVHDFRYGRTVPPIPCPHDPFPQVCSSSAEKVLPESAH